MLPAAAQGATVNLDGSTLEFNAVPGETNIAVIARQGPGSYFVGDQGGSTVTPANTVGLLCIATPPASGLPAGFLCATTATSLRENLGDGNDTGVIADQDNGLPGEINGEAGSDQMLGGLQDDTFFGGAGSDTVAYAGLAAAGISRAAGVTAVLPERPAGPATTGNGQTGLENDTINPDVEGVVGGNGNDNLTGSNGPDTIAGAVPPGTPLVTTTPAGVDTINGNGGADTLLAGDSGSVTGGLGADQIVGGRSTSAPTVIHGGADGDTIVSGLGDDDVFGDAGSNTLAYASVLQGGLTIVNRGTSGVTASLPNTGATAAGGRTGSAESDTIHDDIQTLVGSNGNDALGGSNRTDFILGVAPAGTPGVVPGPPGNDALTGGGGVDVLIGNSGNDLIRSRDGLVESPTCGGGTDSVTADPTDTPAADCERVDTGATPPPGGQTPGGQAPTTDRTKPELAERPAVFGLRRGRRVVVRLACPNEATGCRGTFALRTRRRFRLGRRRAQRVTLARVQFRTTSRRSTRLSIKLSRRVLRLVRRGRSLRLIGAATIKDSSGNRTKTSVRLRLKRR